MRHAGLLTSSGGEPVDLVRFLRLGGVKLSHFLDVWSLVEGTAKTRLELSVVRLLITLAPTARVLGPLLKQNK